MSEPEPRRSVRSTKGQHKTLDQLDQPIPAFATEPKKRGRKPSKKAKEKSEEPEEEVIRCVCGATEQDEIYEQWTACDKCNVWQHNVCMGLSLDTADTPKEYFCELCKPKDHPELVAAMARGEKPWLERQQRYDEEERAKGKKKKGSKATKKRASDVKDDTASTAKGSPVPESKKDKEPKSTAGNKRKSRGPSEEKADIKAGQKVRKVSETQAAPVPKPKPKPYDPPGDIAKSIADLPDTSRQNIAKALTKSITHALGAIEKKHGSLPNDGVPADKRAEQLALQIERSVHDTHATKQEYSQQLKTLVFNVKNNIDLCAGLLDYTITPPALAIMTSDQLASKEMQKETAEIKARAEKQSILITEDAPRVRRTHKGEELIEDNTLEAKEDKPSTIRRPSVREKPVAQPDQEDTTMADGEEVELPDKIDVRPASSKEGLHIDTQQLPKNDFDINKVFSSVRSPCAGQHRRPSQATPVHAGVNVDADVDRMLQDDREDSEPYSPSDETDPNIIWRGQVKMASMVDFPATAQHVGGANISKTAKVPWTKLIPRLLSVAGRIQADKATEYLCGLRYSPPTDVIVTSISPANEGANQQFMKLFNYFEPKKRFAVIGDKGVGNVRDTYLIPVTAGTGNVPEFMLNLEDNFLPYTRDQPMLLAVFVYRNEPSSLDKIHGPNWSQQTTPQSPMVGTPTPSATAGFNQRHPSISGPAFSPTTPQVPVFPKPQLPSEIIPPYDGAGAAPIHQNSAVPGPQDSHPPPAAANGDPQAALKAKQHEGEALAHRILGPYISCPTVNFLLPQAHEMIAKEWQLIRNIYEQEPKAREDLQYLSEQIVKLGKQQQSANNQGPAQAQVQGQGINQVGGATSQPPVPPRVSQTPVPIPHIPHTSPTTTTRTPPVPQQQQQQPIQPVPAAAPVAQPAGPPPA